MPYLIDAADLDELVELVATVPGLDRRRPAPTDDDPDRTEPAQVALIGVPVELPGVVVEPQSYRLGATLGDYSMSGRLLLVVPDNPPRAALAALASLLNQVSSFGLTPAGPVDHIAVALPDQGAPLPGLAFPYTVRCTTTPPQETP